MDYWTEHAEIAMNEAGLPMPTKDQLETIAGVMESAHDFFGQAMGHDVASSNFHAETKRKAEAAQRQFEKDVGALEADFGKRIKNLAWERDQLKFQLEDARRQIAELRR